MKLMNKKFFQKPPTKSDLRNHLDQDVDTFLASGGEISTIAQGETALENRQGPLQAPLFTEPRAKRTPLDDVVAALDERQKTHSSRAQRASVKKYRPRKQVIYDDFGEPVRTVWRED